MAPALYQAATSDSKAWTRSGVLRATMAPVTFCCNSLAVYGVKSRLMVTLGATCLYWSTSAFNVPPWVPGSVPFMPCQNVIVTGAAAGFDTAVAAFAIAAATVGAACATAVAAGWAAAATVGATAAALVAAGATCVGVAGAGLEHAPASKLKTKG